MPSVKFVIVTLSLIAVMLMMTVQSRHLVPFKKNLDQVLKEWNCKGPQSQLVYLEDEWDDYNPSAIYLPHAAVLKRCGKTVGCCKNGQVCAAAETEEITFIFEEIYRGKKERKEVTLSNHVRCECQLPSIDSPR